MLNAEQLEQRLSYVTGSDAATICGVNPWQTQVELWQYKTRRAVAQDIGHKPAVKAGNMLEDGVADWFAYDTGKMLVSDKTFHIHKSIPYLGGNIDRIVVGENAILECKTTQSSNGWGLGFEQGDNKIPDNYLCQVVHYCAVVDCDAAYIAVLIKGIDFRWFKYVRDRDIEDALLKREMDFWINYVQADVCPKPTTEKEVLISLQGRVSNEEKVATGAILDAIEYLQGVRADLAMIEANEQELRNDIAIYMGDKQYLVNEEGKTIVTWKQQQGSLRVDTDKLMKKYPDIYTECLVRGKEQRKFLIKD